MSLKYTVDQMLSSHMWWETKNKKSLNYVDEIAKKNYYMSKPKFAQIIGSKNPINP
jgi:cell division protein FtsB